MKKPVVKKQTAKKQTAQKKTEKTPLFSQASIDFIDKAARQKKVAWLDKNQEEFDTVLVEPMKALMQAASDALKSEARGYRFPLRRTVRIKRNSDSAKEGNPFRDWVAVSVSRDSGSRYDSCPNLYFHIDGEDVLSAGGLYMPSADQTKHIRKWIDQDPSLLEALFKDKDFKKRFPDFGDERVLKTKPRDYPIDHPKFDWLRLSGWYVWRPFTKKEFFSPKFHEILIEDWKQILRLNQILDRYTQSWPNAQKEVKGRKLDW